MPDVEWEVKKNPDPAGQIYIMLAFVLFMIIFGFLA